MTRRRVSPLSTQFSIFKVDLVDDKLSKHYALDYGIPTFLRGTVTVLVDANDKVKQYINKDFEFEVYSKGYYGGSPIRCFYDRFMMLPRDLVNDFAIDVDDGIELVLKEHVFKDETGKEEIEKIFSESRVKGPMDFEPKGFNSETVYGSEMLVTTQIADEDYNSLVLEINGAFSVGLFTATLVLVRKLFESLIIDVLRLKFGMGQMELFYSKEDNGFHTLHRLIKNLGANLNEFKPYGFFKLEREKEGLMNFLWKIKDESNASAHSFGPLLGREEVNALKPSINEYSSLLVRIAQKVKETP